MSRAGLKMTIEQTLVLIAAFATMLSIALGFAILIWKDGQWAGAAGKNHTDTRHSRLWCY
jgi:hypothetical protein